MEEDSKQPIQQPSGITRRNFLRTAGIAAAAGGLSALHLPGFTPAVAPLVSGPQPAYAADNGIPASRIPLRFDSNGDFKVLVISDTHGNASNLPGLVKNNIKRIIDRERPDLIIFNGDNTQDLETEEQVRGCVGDMVARAEELGIPWAHIYGNHDAYDQALDKASQQAIYESFPYCVSQAGPSELYGQGNYILPILRHDSDEVAYAIWAMDSGQTISDELYDQLYKSFYSYRDHAWSTYSHLHPSLVAWYWTRSVQIEQAYGHKIPALMALHIPIQECYTAWMNRSGLDWNGARNEGVCAGELNSGIFASVIERGDVKAIVFGHDHVNDYSIEYCGVRLCGSSTLSPLGYWSENNAGARVFVLHEDGSFSTRMSYLYSNTWTLESVEVAKAATVGEEVGFSPVISGEADNLQFNYAWRRGDGWDEWNSTVKETGEMTSETSGRFTPAKAGVYYVWVDAQDDMGRKQTSDMYELHVEPRDEDKWTLESVTASGAKVVGKPVEFSAVITGKTEGLSYNYAWSFGDGWEHWSSTMKETGAMTQETHGTFTPDRAGIYNVWIDVEDEFGIRVTSDVLPVEIDAAPITWTLEGVDAPSSGSVGEPLSFSAQVSGETDGLRYNYAWSYEGLWGDNWSSTRLRTGDYTSELSDTFTPDKVGTYYLWVDVTDGYRVETSEQLAVSVAAAPEPQPAWTLVDVDAPEIGTAGEELGFSAVIEGDATGLMFSYAWAAGESGWDEWSSTKKENDGAMTTETTGHFTPEHSGIYRVWLDVQDAQGNQTTSATKFITVSDE